MSQHFISGSFWARWCILLFKQYHQMAVLHHSIPAAPIPPRANPRALALFFVFGGKFPGVGMKEEGKCPTPGISWHTLVLNAKYMITLNFQITLQCINSDFSSCSSIKQWENAWNLGNIPWKTSAILSNPWRTSQSVTNYWTFPIKSSTFGFRVRNNVCVKSPGVALG